MRKHRYDVPWFAFTVIWNVLFEAIFIWRGDMRAAGVMLPFTVVSVLALLGASIAMRKI